MSYPISGGCWVCGIPLPAVIFEPSADKTSLLPFTSPISPIAILANLAICVFVLLWLRKWLER